MLVFKQLNHHPQTIEFPDRKRGVPESRWINAGIEGRLDITIGTNNWIVDSRGFLYQWDSVLHKNICYSW